MSSTPSKEFSSVWRVSPSSSNAPDFIKLSIHFLFTASPCILSAKSVKLLNSPFFSLSCTIVSTADVPTFLTLPSPKRILLSFTVNFVKLLFILGFKISIFNLLHSTMYSGILSKFPRKLFKVAAINSAG